MTTDEFHELADWIIEVSASGGGEFIVHHEDSDETSRAMVDEIQARYNAGESLAGLQVEAPGGAGA